MRQEGRHVIQRQRVNLYQESCLPVHGFLCVELSPACLPALDSCQTAHQFMFVFRGRPKLVHITPVTPYQLTQRSSVFCSMTKPVIHTSAVLQVVLLDFAPDHAASYNALVEVIRRNLLLADWCDDAHNEVRAGGAAQHMQHCFAVVRIPAASRTGMCLELLAGGCQTDECHPTLSGGSAEARAWHCTGFRNASHHIYWSLHACMQRSVPHLVLDTQVCLYQG